MTYQLCGCNPGGDGNIQPPDTSSDQELIEDVIKRFMRGGDDSDIPALQTVLHDQFRVVVNQGVLGGESLRTVDKAAYLNMIGAKKWGGVARTINIVSVSIASTVAAAEVKTSSVRSDMTSFLHLAKGADGHWLVVAGTPFPVAKKAN